jgi:WhiB family redox-sensing transcriptional regulator
MFAFELDQEYQDLSAPDGLPVVDWDAASCRDGTGSMTDLFFSDEIPDIIAAKRICSGCPVAGPCLDGALGRREPWGVWGGQLFVNGRILAQKRKRGRPPKNPAPGIQLTA